MKKIKQSDVFKCSPDMIFINAAYRRKILSKWVLLDEVVFEDPKGFAKFYFTMLHNPYQHFANPDMTHWHELIIKEQKGDKPEPLVDNKGLPEPTIIPPMPKCKPAKDDAFESPSKILHSNLEATFETVMSENTEYRKNESHKHRNEFCEKFYNKFKMQIFSPELEQQIDDTLKLGEELKRSIKDIHLTGKFTYKKSADCPNCEFLDKLFSDIQHRSYREKYLYHEVFVYLHGGDELCNWNELCNWKEE